MTEGLDINEYNCREGFGTHLAKISRLVRNGKLHVCILHKRVVCIWPEYRVVFIIFETSMFISHKLVNRFNSLSC